jgi:presenilin-like A22 family membrane protease
VDNFLSCSANLFLMNKKLLLQLVVLFCVTQLIGLATGLALIKMQVHPTIVTDNPQDISNAVGLIVYILIFTAVLLIVIKFVKGIVFFKALEALAIFGASWLVFDATIGQLSGIIWLGLALAVLLIVLRNVFRKNIWLRNVSTILAAAGVGAIVGVALGLVPVLVFVIALGVYDFIAVFKTKHMVTLAKAITKKNLAFTYALPTKEHTFELGTGDMVVPLAVAVSVLADSFARFPYPQSLVPSVLVLIGSLAGLLWTINYASGRVGRALPALPPQVVAMLIMLGVSKLIGF